MFRDVPGCSGMFRHVPECFGMFHVPGFIDALIPPGKGLWSLTPMTETSELSQNNRSASKYLPLTVEKTDLPKFAS